MISSRHRSVVLLGLSLVLIAPGFTWPADLVETPFHAGTGKDKPDWSQKAQKRLEACTADYQAVRRGQKPIFAQPDPTEESTANEQFYQGDRYQIHVTKSPVVIDGVSGFIYGPIIELEEGFAKGEMLSILCASFYTIEEMKKAEPSDTPFHLGTGKDQPAWNQTAQKRIADGTADFQAVLEGRKPVHAKSADSAGSRFYRGEGYQIDIVKESIVIGGVAGFLYGPILDLDADPSQKGDLDSISHVAFYTVGEMKKLLEKK